VEVKFDFQMQAFSSGGFARVHRLRSFAQALTTSHRAEAAPVTYPARARCAPVTASAQTAFLTSVRLDLFIHFSKEK
jgi:hypothetical protein